MELPSLTAAFLAGMLTILTPCCLPLLPPLLSGSVGHRLRPPAIVAGSVVSFTALGVAVGSLGALSPDSLRLPAFLIIVAFGAVMADDDLHRLYSRYASRLAGAATARSSALEESRHPVASAFVLGLTLGVIWLPCVGPVLGAVLAYAATTGTAAGSGLLLFVYALGFAVPMLGVAYGGERAGARMRERVDGVGGPAAIRRLAGYALLLTGVALLFELDRVLLSAL